MKRTIATPELTPEFLRQEAEIIREGLKYEHGVDDFYIGQSHGIADAYEAIASFMETGKWEW